MDNETMLAAVRKMEAELASVRKMIEDGDFSAASARLGVTVLGLVTDLSADCRVRHYMEYCLPDRGAHHD